MRQNGTPFGAPGNAFRALLAALCALFATAASAGMGDKVVRFSTPGVDRYADGTAVCDGECYALVWSPAGRTFSGFNADGTAVSSEDRVVLAGALAKDGRCRTTLFQIPIEKYAALEGGVWAVCLVDTRRAGGTPAGTEDNAPVRVNRWGAVDGNVTVSSAGSLALPARSAARLYAGNSGDAGSTGNAGVRASTLSAVPAGTPMPRITAFEVVGGVAYLTVEDTVPFLTYGVASGETPRNLAADADSTVADGIAGGAIELEVGASDGARFFRVTRADQAMLAEQGKGE